MSQASETNDLMRRIRGDLLDSLDEEFEMEFEDRQYGGDGAQADDCDQEERERRVAYFRELFRLQGELVKLRTGLCATGARS